MVLEQLFTFFKVSCSIGRNYSFIPFSPFSRRLGLYLQLTLSKLAAFCLQKSLGGVWFNHRHLRNID